MSAFNTTGISVKAKRRASIEKPWLKYYPEAMRNFEYEPTTLHEFLCQYNRGHFAPVVDYYGRFFSLRSILSSADAVAKSLAAAGVGEGSKIAMFIRTTPEFLFILLAAEKLGATLVCREGSDEEKLEAIIRAEAEIAFAPDYLSKETEEFFYSNSNLKHLVLVSPYTYAERESIPSYIEANIERLYPENRANDSRNISWEDLLEAGKRHVGYREASRDPNRPLYHSYTSGSCGPSKEVMHSAATMCGFMSQLIIPSGRGAQLRITCLYSLLPPALVAVVNPMLLYNIASGNLLILDSFCELKDLDLEFMRYMPNQLVAVPMMADYLMNSPRIPEDYSMDFLYVIGGGADPVHNKWLNKMQEFLKKHNSPAVFSMCYGLSEGGSGVANPHGKSTFFNCGAGIPMRGTTIGIFEPNTQNELGYGEVGQICVSGPSCMIGYTDPVETAKTIQVHDDGLTWVHTGDYGYMNENGELFVLGRGLNKRFGGGYMYLGAMENKICDIPGILDCFFVLAADKEHKGYMVPYLYVVLEDDLTFDRLNSIKSFINRALDQHEQPARITIKKRREYFAFKTNRRILAAQIDSETNR